MKSRFTVCLFFGFKFTI